MRVKMIVHRIEHGAGPVPQVTDGKMEHVRGVLTTIELVPAHHGNDPAHPNAELWSASPGGQLRLTIASSAAPSAAPDQEFWVDVTPVEAAPAAEASPLDAPAGELESLPAGLLEGGSETPATQG